MRRHGQALPRIFSAIALSGAIVGLVACTPVVEDGQIGGDGDGQFSETPSSTDEASAGLTTKLGYDIPADHMYYMTAFGGPDDPHSTSTMSCGGAADGVSFYIADRQRFQVGGACKGARKVKLTATDKHGVTRCVYAKAADAGPALFVEQKAGKPVIDASPAITQILFGVNHAGWSDHLPVLAEPADDNVVVGPNCTVGTSGTTTTGTTTPAPKPPAAPMQSTPTGTSCFSGTWQLTMSLNECVQSSADHYWYKCTPSGWESLTTTFADCTITHAL